MTTELPTEATLQIDVGDGCAPGQWTEVAHATLDPAAEPPTLSVALEAAPLPARRTLEDARDGAVPLDIALVREDGALYAYTANARAPLAGEPVDDPATVVVEVVRLLVKIGG